MRFWFVWGYDSSSFTGDDDIANTPLAWSLTFYHPAVLPELCRPYSSLTAGADNGDGTWILPCRHRKPFPDYVAGLFLRLVCFRDNLLPLDLYPDDPTVRLRFRPLPDRHCFQLQLLADWSSHRRIGLYGGALSTSGHGQTD